MSGSAYCRDSLQKARRDPRLQRPPLATARALRHRLQRIPEGDIAAAIDAAARAAITGSPASSAWTRCCGKWQAAGVSLLMLAILLGAAMMAAP